jgi:hypothetical protein
MAAYLVNHPYDDLPLNECQRREVGAQIALSLFLGESVSGAVKRILQLTGGGFACAPLEEFLRTNPRCGYGPKTDPNNPKDLIELYVQTRLGEATVTLRLKQVLRSRESRVIRGIEILCMGDTCEICSGGKRQYYWSEIDDLPRIPRHWGCGCCYVAWIPK